MSELVDSSGWIEYLQDTSRAALFADAIEDHNTLLVPTMALFEVHKVLSRRLPAELVERCRHVMRLGRVLDFTDARAIAAAQIAASHQLAMADAAMYSMAQDADYEGLLGGKYFAK